MGPMAAPRVMRNITMAKKKIVLTFPPTVVKEPITYRLVKEHDLMVNIVSASISSDEQGHMVLELSGDTEKLDSGIKYLSDVGISWQPLEQDVRWIEEMCTHCTACITACPSEALIVDRRTMVVSFDRDKCIGCGLCIPVCSYDAIEITL